MTVLSLLDLPPELHILIAENLPFPDVIYFKITCSYLNSLLHPLTLQELILAETTPYAFERDLWTCRHCLRLRPACEFADRMRHRRRNKYGSDAGKRFCVECGLQPREGRDDPARYGPGAQIVIDGVLYVLCLTCREFKLAARQRPGREATRECEACTMKREGVQLEWARAKVRPMQLQMNGMSRKCG